MNGTKMYTPAYIEAFGTNYDVGRSIGESLREVLIAHSDERWAFYKKSAKKEFLHIHGILESNQAIIFKYFPQYLDELRGLADGATLTLTDVLLLCSEEVVSNGATGQCTTFAYGTAENVILGHNEDWEADYEDKLYVVKAKPREGAAFISLAYVGTLGGSSVALNEFGVAFSGNSMLGGAQPGVPKNIILRSQIEAKSLEQFERLATFQPRAIPNHSMAIDRKGAMVSVEVGLNEQSTFYTSGSYVHTNHPIHERMVHLASGSMESSMTRYRTAQELVSNGTLDDHLARQILRSHQTAPYTICIHPQPILDSHNQTVASAIVNLSEMSLSVTLGNPCQSEYQKFYL